MICKFKSFGGFTQIMKYIKPVQAVPKEPILASSFDK